MKIKEIRNKAGDLVSLLSPSNTYYPWDIPLDVITLIEGLMKNKNRVVLDIGDIETNTVFRSMTGYVRECLDLTSNKVPVLLKSKNSITNTRIPLGNIIRVRFARKTQGGLIYENKVRRFLGPRIF